MIELKNVSAGYEEQDIIKNVSISFPKGKVSVLIGPNGCGKTTLLKTALGLLAKSEGEILYDGTEISLLSPREIARKAAYLSQSRNIPHITAGKMVLHGRFPYLDYPRRYRGEDFAAVDKAMEQTDSLELKHCRMEQLSGGQRQKVYLAMALAQNTDTIFMDEPTTYLDVYHQLELIELARGLADRNKAVVLVLHDLSLALKCADQLAVLSGGELKTAGSPEDIFKSGILNEIFRVRVQRFPTEAGWQYYCEPER